MVAADPSEGAHSTLRSKLRKLRRKYRRNRKRAVILAGEDGVLAGMQWLAATMLGLRVRMRVTIRGVTVTIRTATTDLDVVLASLRGEFDELIAGVPSLRHRLIVDAGGYIGTAAIVFAKAYPDATVVTIEPDEENFGVLAHNVAPFPNIRPLRAALGSSRGTVELRDRGMGHWGMTTVEAPEDAQASVIGTVERLTVADLLERFDRPGIDIVKIDIEGGEYELLSANSGWIGETGAICIELHDRVVSGCTWAYETATAGRVNSKLAGEKYLSLKA